MKIEFKISLEPPRSWVRASVMAGAVVVALGTVMAVAQAKVQPNPFQKNQKLSADAVNKNFTDLADAVNQLQDDRLWSLNHAAAVAACTGVDTKISTIGHTVSVVTPKSGLSCDATCGNFAGVSEKKSIGGVTIGNLRPDQVTEENQIVGSVNVYPSSQTANAVEFGATYDLNQRFYCCCY